VKRRSVALPLGLRIFGAYALFVALGFWFVVRQVIHEVKPAVRQSTEETLVDTANLLAEILSDDLARGALEQSDWSEVLQKYGQRRPDADIWGVKKEGINHQIYVVDRHGKVLLDSSGRDVGKDYSQWRDVYLTLRGKYGARSTRAAADDDGSTVMYVAAPVYEGASIIGAVTVAKPNHAVQPFIVAARDRLMFIGLAFVTVGLLLGACLSYWLSHAVRKLTTYARSVSAGERAFVPELPSGELAQLAQALESMRAELDGQAYIEQYAQTLTHELKSPLAAIRAAAELLKGDMAPDRRARFLQNIDNESERLQVLGERLLSLARVERRRALAERQSFDVASVWADLARRFEDRLAHASVTLERDIQAGTLLEGEIFLVTQAWSNLLENALDFTPNGGRIHVSVVNTGRELDVRVWNRGDPIPDYALVRVTERFYSLPRPRTGRKSTGLGLNFVAQVAELHAGAFRIENHADGVLATMVFPG
jgi:two-component system, OmpR family, sensor histidine kinase CreC